MHFFRLLVDGKKNENADNVGSNNNAICIPSHDQVKAYSLDNYQNIENLFKNPINIAKTQDVSINSICYTSKGID